jgi:hypothetical protein
LLLVVVPAGSAAAGEIDSLEAERSRLVAVEDSLLVQRALLVVDVGRLSARVDSLKREGTGTAAAGPLQRALREALRLTVLLEDVDGRVDRARTDLESTQARLREAYDREIRETIQHLGQAPDAATIGRLTALQQAREGLETRAASGPPARGAELLTIGPEDGPDQIRQKAALMEDLAGQMESRAEAADRRLVRLVEEQRLRSRVSAFARELTLFDENLPEGRALSRGEGSEVQDAPESKGSEESAVDADRGLLGAGDAESVPEAGPPEELLMGRELSREGGEDLLEDLASDDLQTEIRRLEARRESLRVRAQGLTVEAERFRSRIKQMLEEGR